VEGQIVVGFENPAGKTALSPDTLAEIEALLPGKVLKRSRLKKHLHRKRVVMELPEGLSVEDAVAQVKALNHPGIRYVEPNSIMYRNVDAPDDTHYTKQWALHNTGQDYYLSFSGTVDKDIDWPQAVEDYMDDTTDCEETVVVAVLDTGVNYNHDDLELWTNSGETPDNDTDDDGNGYTDDYHGYDFAYAPRPSSITEDSDPMDTDGHGTHVAGIIGAIGDNASGVTGVGGVGETSSSGPCVQVMNVRIGSLSGAISADVADGIDYVINAVDDGVNVRVMNLSWGDPSESSALETAVSTANDDGILLVTSAGNSARSIDVSGNEQYPASWTYANIVVVANQNDDGGKIGTSNWGTTSVDLAAPGERIYSTELAWTEVENEDFEGLSDGALPSGWSRGGDSLWGAKAGYGAGNEEMRCDYANSEPYTSNASAYLYTPTYDVSGAKGLVIEFKHRYELETYGDYVLGFAWWSGDAWENVYSRSSSTTFYGPYYTYLVDADRLKADDFQMRFWWYSDGDNNNYFGCAIDDLVIRKVSTTDSYDYKGGTSMAAPHVAGAAAMHWAMDKDLTMAQVRGLLLDSTDYHSDWSSKTVTEGNLNLWQTDQDSDGDLPRGERGPSRRRQQRLRERVRLRLRGFRRLRGYGRLHSDDDPVG
jgi:subtilisin family serine protease